MKKKEILKAVKDLYGYDKTEHLSDPRKTSNLSVNPSLEDPSKIKPSPLNDWWQKKNAEHYRDQCPLHANYVFSHSREFELAFGTPLSGVFVSHGNWRIPQSFPEIHVTLLAVDVFQLCGPWNKRDVDTKQALLNELRRGYVEFAHQKGYQLEGLYNVLVTDLWLINHTLILEIPNSVFSVRYPELCRILVPESYMKRRRELSRRTTL